MQTGRFMRWKPDSPAAAWYSLFFFTKNFAQSAKFFVKKKESPALPEATFPFGSVTA